MTLLWCSSKFAQLYKLSLCNKINPFTGEFMVTVSNINGLFFLFFLNKFIVK